MNSNTSIKPGALVHIPRGTFVIDGPEGYHTLRSHSVQVKEVSPGLYFTPKEIVSSAYYRGLYEAKGGDLNALNDLKKTDPKRFARDQIQLFAPLVTWQGRFKKMLQTSTDNVVELKM